MTELQADVIVIGGGGAGLMAASEAALLGCRVILIEKNATLGGSTAWSVGSVSCSNSSHQKRLGIKDTPQEHFEDLAQFAGERLSRDNPGLRRLLVEHIPDTFKILQKRGLVFIGPALEPPHRHPRMHNVVPSSKAYPYHLGRHCLKCGVQIELGVRAHSLITQNGRVTGVRAERSDGSEITLQASRGVVLAAGDYSASSELKGRYAGSAAAGSNAVNVTNTGDGHKMALALGAQVVNGDIVHGPILRFLPAASPSWIASIPPYTAIAKLAAWAMHYLPQRLLRPVLMSFATTALGPDPGLFRAGAVLVNKDGQRFVDEADHPARALVSQPDGTAYIVLGKSVAEKFSAWPHFISTAPNVAYAYLADYKRNRSDIYHEAPDCDSLADKLGMQPEALRESLAKSGGPGDATAGSLVALGPVKSYVVLTDGGVRVSDRLEVIGADAQPIPGLFAAGATGQGGLLLYGHGHHLAWAFVSGRIAGRHAAQNLSAASPAAHFTQ